MLNQYIAVIWSASNNQRDLNFILEICKIHVMTKIIKTKNILYTNKNKNKYKSGNKPITCADNNSPCKKKKEKVLCALYDMQLAGVHSVLPLRMLWQFPHSPDP